MKIYKVLIAIFCVLLITTNLNAQRNYTQEADVAFRLENFADAVELYKKSYSKVKVKTEKSRIIFQLAECYRLTNETRKAESFYKKSIKTKYPDAIQYLHYADMLRIRGKYEEALEQYKIYAEKTPKDVRGANGVVSCEIVPQWLENPSRYEITNARKMNSKINSRENDFAPAYADKKFKVVVFTSDRSDAAGNKTDVRTGNNHSDFFFITQDRKEKWSLPKSYGEDMLNSTNVNDGAATFNKKATVIYFTRCPYKKKEKLGCQIYSARKKGRTWGEPESLELAQDSFAVGHPTISKDEKVIYFASDIPGGEGGKDIWVARRTKKTKPFGRPENLGPKVNTAGDEMYPFLRNDDLIYFSSNGHVGMGGLDIYKTERLNGEWKTPENMKHPINSSSDDFGLVFNSSIQSKSEPEEGWMSSDRRGTPETGGRAKGGDDIYYVYMPPLVFTLQGVIKDDSTLLYVAGAKVKLIGSDGTSIEGFTSSKGKYMFDKTQINYNTSYDLQIIKEGYFSGKGKTTSVALEKSKDLFLDVNLIPIPEDPFILPEIRYQTAKWELQDQYKDSLNDLYDILTKNPHLVVELGSHTDPRDTDIKNDTLSLKRAVSVVEYLIEKGIAPDRMVPKGYGEREPRKLPNGYTYQTKDYKGISFPAGTELSEDYINSLRSKREKEAAHQLNRRTTFRVLRTNYVPSKNANDSIAGNVTIVTAPDENVIYYIAQTDGKIKMECNLNGDTRDFFYDTKNASVSGIYVSLDEAKILLSMGNITKNSFEGVIDTVLQGGTIQDESVFIIDEIAIGDQTIENVKATVSHELPVSMLLGKDIILKFGEFTINEQKTQLIIQK